MCEILHSQAGNYFLYVGEVSGIRKCEKSEITIQ